MPRLLTFISNLSFVSAHTASDGIQKSSNACIDIYLTLWSMGYLPITLLRFSSWKILEKQRKFSPYCFCSFLPDFKQLLKPIHFERYVFRKFWKSRIIQLAILVLVWKLSLKVLNWKNSAKPTDSSWTS